MGNLDTKYIEEKSQRTIEQERERKKCFFSFLQSDVIIIVERQFLLHVNRFNRGK